MAKAYHDFYLEVVKALGITEHVNRITRIDMAFIASATPQIEVRFLMKDDQQTALKEVVKKYKWVGYRVEEPLPWERTSEEEEAP